MKKMARVFYAIGLILVFFVGCGASNEGIGQITPQGEKRFYTLGYGDDWETQMRKREIIIYSAPLDWSDFTSAFKVKLPRIRDPYMEGLLKYTVATNFGSAFYFYLEGPHTCSLEGLSPDKQWALLSAGTGFYFEIPHKEDGKLLKEISAKYTILYNLKNGSSKKLGARYRKSFYHDDLGELVKESGVLYFPVYWGEKELLLVEQTKENKFFGTSGKYCDPRVVTMDLTHAQVPYAHARGVRLSLDDLSITTTDRVKPIRPWVTFADQTTGIVGYVGPYDKTYPESSDIPNITNVNCERNTYAIADMSGKKIWIFQEKLKNFEDSEYKTCEYAIVSTSKDSVFIFAGYMKPGFGEAVAPRYRNYLLRLDMNSGEVKKIKEFDQNTFSDGCFIRASHPDKAYIFAGVHNETKTKVERVLMEYLDGKLFKVQPQNEIPRIGEDYYIR